MNYIVKLSIIVVSFAMSCNINTAYSNDYTEITNDLCDGQFVKCKIKGTKK